MLQSDVAIFKNDKKLRLFLAVCVVPAIALLVYVVVIPTYNVFSMSLFNQTALSSVRTFAGLDNYRYLLQDEYFLQALGNTCWLMAVVPVATLFLALVLAAIITQSGLREKSFTGLSCSCPACCQQRSSVCCGPSFTTPTWAF